MSSLVKWSLQGSVSLPLYLAWLSILLSFLRCTQWWDGCSHSHSIPSWFKLEEENIHLFKILQQNSGVSSKWVSWSCCKAIYVVRVKESSDWTNPRLSLKHSNWKLQTRIAKQRLWALSRERVGEGMLAIWAQTVSKYTLEENRLSIQKLFLVLLKNIITEWL